MIRSRGAHGSRVYEEAHLGQHQQMAIPGYSVLRKRLNAHDLHVQGTSCKLSTRTCMLDLQKVQTECADFKKSRTVCV